MIRAIAAVMLWTVEIAIAAIYMVQWPDGGQPDSFIDYELVQVKRDAS